MKGNCKLCNTEKELRQSHILPEFMYQNLYDPQPKRFYTLSVDLDNSDNSKRKIEQKGTRESLFCDTCEGLLSKYEHYAAETIYAKNKGNKAYITNASQTPDLQYFLYDYAGFSYKEFKIFLLSILYRIIICKRFNTPNIAEGIEEQLRQAILNENPWTMMTSGA